MRRIYPYFVFLMIVAAGYFGVTRFGLDQTLLDVNLLGVVMEVGTAAMYLGVFLFCGIGIFIPIIGTFLGARLGIMAAPNWAVFGAIFGAVIGMMAGYVGLDHLLVLSYGLAGAGNVMPELPLPALTRQGEVLVALLAGILALAGLSRRFIFRERKASGADDNAEEEYTPGERQDFD